VNKDDKQQLVSELAGKLAGAKAAFLADYRGLTVEQVNKLRSDLRNAGVEYRVVKNTLLRLASQGTDLSCLDKHLAGPTAIAIASADPVASAKILSEFARVNAKFELKAGALGGKLLTAADIKALAELPSREVLLGKLLGTLNAPVANFVGVLAAVPRSLVQVLAAVQEKKAA
jgi:large subunit ribosomal protein L10